MKKYVLILLLLPFLLSIACSTLGGRKASAYEIPLPKTDVTQDTPIEEIGAYFARSLTLNFIVALITMDTEKRTLSDYIFDELWGCFEDRASFTFVEHQRQIPDNTGFRMKLYDLINNLNIEQNITFALSCTNMIKHLPQLFINSGSYGAREIL